jgi:hypothetical protein
MTQKKVITRDYRSDYITPTYWQAWRRGSLILKNIKQNQNLRSRLNNSNCQNKHSHTFNSKIYSVNYLPYHPLPQMSLPRQLFLHILVHNPIQKTLIFSNRLLQLLSSKTQNCYFTLDFHMILLQLPQNFEVGEWGNQPCCWWPYQILVASLLFGSLH